jgi:hypothetical protein
MPNKPFTTVCPKSWEPSTSYKTGDVIEINGEACVILDDGISGPCEPLPGETAGVLKFKKL